MTLEVKGIVNGGLDVQDYKVSRIELFQVGAFDAPASRFDGGELTGMNQTADSRLGQSRVAGGLFGIQEELARLPKV